MRNPPSSGPRTAAIGPDVDMVRGGQLVNGLTLFQRHFQSCRFERQPVGNHQLLDGLAVGFARGRQGNCGGEADPAGRFMGFEDLFQRCADCSCGAVAHDQGHDFPSSAGVGRLVQYVSFPDAR